jgi:hypothetical protein
MKNIDLNKMWIGILLGLLSPSIAFAGYYLLKYKFMTIHEFINFLKLGDIYTSVISLCVLANLVVFYPFIWKEKWNGARGVLAATFIWAALVLILKFTA